MIGVAIVRRAGEAKARQALEQDRQRDLHFEPGQRSADAEMNAAAEAQYAAALSRVRSNPCGR